MRSTLAALAAAAAVPAVLAQTYTSCNPTEKTCPANKGLDATSFSTNFTKGSSAATGWTLASGTTLTYGSNGAEFTISKEGEAPTISTDFYFFFGTVEVVMQAAPGQGIVSSIVLESSDLDEIDWEFVGTDTDHAQSDYFGKDNTTLYNRAVYQNVSSPQTSFHTYKVDWSAERIVWSIDGAAVRTLPYADALGGKNFPQTPMVVKLGSWAGGAAGEPAGTVEWAGGATDFADTPFTMYVRSVSITNANPADKYVYTNETGDWQSIEIVSAGGADGYASGSSVVDADEDDASASATSTAAAATSTAAAAAKTSKTAASSSRTATASAFATPVILGVGNATSTLKSSTGTGGGGATAATGAGNSTTAATTNGTTAATASPTALLTSGAAAAADSAVGGVVLLFTLSMCAWML